jgi:hypothetical protein
MFAGLCRDWRRRPVLQCRVRVGVQCSQGGYSTHWENIYFYMYWIDKNIYTVIETEPTIWWNVYALRWFISFDYV